MNRRLRIVLTVAGSLVAVLLFAAAGAGGSGEDGNGPNDRDVPITGPALEAASSAALDHLGEGRVTETEIEDEDSFYEVEVTLDDGREVDVQLDVSFNVVATEYESDSD